MKQLLYILFIVISFSATAQELHLSDKDAKGNFFTGFLSKPYEDWKIDFLSIHKVDSVYHITYGVREANDSLQRVFTDYFIKEINNDSTGFHFKCKTQYILHTISFSGIKLYGKEMILIMIQEIGRNGSGFNVFVELSLEDYNRLLKNCNEK